VLLPVGGGMALRAWRPGWAARSRRRLHAAGLGLLVIVLGMALVRARASLAGLLTLAAMAIGHAVALALTAEGRARTTIAVEHAVRNIPLAVLLATAITADAGVVGFATACFVIHAPLTLLGAAAPRSVQAWDPPAGARRHLVDRSDGRA
jgi:predicted Na+-dependent transporter